MKYIAHVADIHIHRKIHKRISTAWEEFIGNLSELECMIVIAGDVFEDKVKVYDQDINLFKWMITLVENAKIDCVIIPGNHDFNDPKRDLISTVLENTNYNYITLIKDTGRYVINDIPFYVYSPMDECVPEFNLDDKISVAIAHEPVKGCVLDNSFVLQEGRFTIDEFEKYSLTLLGDIHKPQFMTPTIAYCGSLVQKNRGEGLVHGYILWDMETITGDFIQLKSYYNDVIIRAKDNQLIELPEVFDPETVLLEHCNCDKENIERITKLIYDKYNKLTNALDTTKYKECTEVETNKSIIDDQYNYITSILEQKEYSPEDKNTILNLYQSYDKSDRGYRQQWTLKYLQWINIYKYNLASSIDFTTINGISMLQGNNAIGKSSIINILQYILFGGKQGASVLNHELLLNNGNDRNGQIKCTFIHNDNEYIIHRYIRRKGSDTVILYKNGEVHSSGDINSTYDIIKTLIGSREDFLDIPIAGQGRRTFLEMTPKDKSAFICRTLGINNINKSIELNNLNTREVKARLKEVTANDNGITVDQEETTINLLKKKLSDIEIKHATLTDEYATVNVELSGLKEQLIPNLEPYEVVLHKYNNAKELVNVQFSIIDLSIDELKELGTSIHYTLSDVNRVINTYKLKVHNDTNANETYIEYNCDDIRKTINTLELDIKDIIGDGLKNRQNYTDEELKAIADNPVDKPQKYLVECEIETPFVMDKPKEVYAQELSEIKIEHYAITEQELIDEISKIGIQPKDCDYSQLEKSYNQYINVYNKFKHIPQTDIVSGNLNELIKSHAKLKSDINQTKNEIKYVSDDEVNRLKSEINRITEKYKNIQFNNNCTHCQCNSKIIVSMDGLQSKKDTLLNLTNIVELNNKNQNKLDSQNKLLNSIEYSIKKLTFEKCNQLSMEIDNSKKAKSAFDLTQKLERIRKNNINITKANKLKDHIRKCEANENYEKNKLIKTAWDRYNKYIGAVNTLRNERTILAKEKLQTEIPKYKKFLENKHALVVKNVSYMSAKGTIEKYEHIIENHHRNKENTVQIKNLSARHSELHENISSLTTEKNQLEKDITRSDVNLTASLARDKRLAELRSQLNDYKLYDTAMNSKKGIINNVIRNTSTTIQNVWNSKLKKMVDFHVDITFDKDKFTVNLKENNKTISADVASGFQKFILDLTLRETLYKTAQIPLPNFIMIDEGFGTADTNNRDEIKQYLQTLSNEYEFVFIISHIEELQNIANCTLNIFNIVDEHGISSYINVGDLSPLIEHDPIAEAVTVKKETLKAEKVRQKAEIANYKIRVENAINGNEPEISDINILGVAMTRLPNLTYRCEYCIDKKDGKRRIIKTRDAAIKHMKAKIHIRKMCEVIFKK